MRQRERPEAIRKNPIFFPSQNHKSMYEFITLFFNVNINLNFHIFKHISYSSLIIKLHCSLSLNSSIFTTTQPLTYDINS